MSSRICRVVFLQHRRPCVVDWTVPDTITPGGRICWHCGWPVRIVPEDSDFSIARLVLLHLELRASLEVWSLLMNHRSDVDEESLV